MSEILTAVLVDGGWFTQTLRDELKLTGYPTVDQVYNNALSVIDSGTSTPERLLKILYYDSSPLEIAVRNPVSGKTIDFKTTTANSQRKRFYKALGEKEFVALRIGVLKFRGWGLSKTYLSKVNRGGIPQSPSAADIVPRSEQKGVDMRIGIDVAMMALRRQVQRIIILSGDMDMIPAMKLARREGIQIGVVSVGSTVPTSALIEDSDFLRAITPTK